MTVAQSQGDLLMKFVQANGEAVKAEGTSSLTSANSLVADFLPGKYFEIDSFGLGLNVEDSEIGSNALNPSSSERGGAAEATAHKQKFSAWRDAKKKTRSQIAQIAYPVVLEPFSFSRLMDRASPIFFQNCCNSVSFESASLVKRKPTGASMALQGFLRIDFKNVLIIGVDWDDGQAVKEKCKFICRGVSVQYKRQANDGSLGAASNAEWSRDLATRSAAG